MLLSALMSRTFFFQQIDTKINDFDEGVLILESFSEAMSFSKLLLLYQKSRLRYGGISLSSSLGW